MPSSSPPVLYTISSTISDEQIMSSRTTADTPTAIGTSLGTAAMNKCEG